MLLSGLAFLAVAQNLETEAADIAVNQPAPTVTASLQCDGVLVPIWASGTALGVITLYICFVFNALAKKLQKATVLFGFLVLFTRSMRYAYI